MFMLLFLLIQTKVDLTLKIEPLVDFLHYRQIENIMKKLMGQLQQNTYLHRGSHLAERSSSLDLGAE